MDLFFLQLAVLIVPLIVSRFIVQAAVKTLDDEQKSLLIDTFSSYPIYGLIVFFVPLVFIYNNLWYVSLYIGIYIIIMMLYSFYKIKKISLPDYFMRRYRLSKYIALSGVVLYFILFWIKYGK